LPKKLDILQPSDIIKPFYGFCPLNSVQIFLGTTLGCNKGGKMSDYIEIIIFVGNHIGCSRIDDRILDNIKDFWRKNWNKPHPILQWLFNIYAS
jgi:hypothetical protein